MKFRYEYWVVKLPTAICFMITAMLSGCKKLVEVSSPVTSTNASIVYQTDALAAAVLTGVYAKLSNASLTGGGPTSMHVAGGLSSDELSLYPGVANTILVGLYTDQLANNLSMAFWTNVYPTIYVANAAIEGLNNSPSLTAAVRQQLMGEAKFVRAFCYFCLTNLYGDVPLALTTDYKVNSLLARSSRAQVYQQIVSDLKDAQNLLSSSYLKADAITISADRVRPTKWAATALLARAYLYTGDYSNAEAQASIVINTATFRLTAPDSAFKANSGEAIWQLQPVSISTNYSTQEGRLFILPPSGPNTSTFPVFLNPALVSNFEPGDLRKTKWVGQVSVNVGGVPTVYSYPFKYKFNTGTTFSEYSMVLRLGEQYLIRAEARAQQNNMVGALADIDSLRNRAGLGVIQAANQADLLNQIMHERRVELFGEWGHRWLDLKRTGTVDAVMSVYAGSVKGGSWVTTAQWYPIPVSELQADPKLVQNQGY